MLNGGTNGICRSSISEQIIRSMTALRNQVNAQIGIRFHVGPLKCHIGIDYRYLHSPLIQQSQRKEVIRAAAASTLLPAHHRCPRMKSR